MRTSIEYNIEKNTIRPILTGVLQVDDGSMCQCDRWGSAQPTEVADIRVVAVTVAVSVHQRAAHAKLESSRVSWKSLRPNKLIKFTFCCFINISNQIKTRISIGEVDEEEGIYVSHLWIQILVSQITVPVHGVRILRIRNISKAKPARRTQKDKEYQMYAHSIQPQPSSVSYHMYLLQEMSLWIFN